MKYSDAINAMVNEVFLKGRLITTEQINLILALAKEAWNFSITGIAPLNTIPVYANINNKLKRYPWFKKLNVHDNDLFQLLVDYKKTHYSADQQLISACFHTGTNTRVEFENLSIHNPVIFSGVKLQLYFERFRWLNDQKNMENLLDHLQQVQPNMLQMLLLILTNKTLTNEIKDYSTYIFLALFKIFEEYEIFNNYPVYMEVFEQFIQTDNSRIINNTDGVTDEIRMESINNWLSDFRQNLLLASYHDLSENYYQGNNIRGKTQVFLITKITIEVFDKLINRELTEGMDYSLPQRLPQ